MHVITLAARKGGVGKTLMTASLSVLASMHSMSRDEADPPDHQGVAVIDLDPQGSLTAWINQRAAPFPAMVQMNPSRLMDGLSEMKTQGFQMVVIDTPPGHGDLVVAAMAAADLVVIPVKPGDLDLEAAMNTLAIADSLHHPYALLPNDATYRSRAMGQTIRQITEMGLPMLPVLHHRVDAALSGGQTALERAPTSRASAELRSVMAAINARLQSIEVPL